MALSSGVGSTSASPYSPPPVEVLTTGAHRPDAPASSTLIVPKTFVWASSAGADTEWRTSICAARWKTSSGEAASNTQRTASASRTSTVSSLAPAAQRLGEVLALAGDERVDHGHAIAARDQGVDQIGSDEAGAAGDHAVHERCRLRSAGYEERCASVEYRIPVANRQSSRALCNFSDVRPPVEATS